MGQVVFKGKTENNTEILVRYPNEKDVESIHKFINSLSAERTYVRTQGEVITLDQEKQYLDNQLKKIKTYHSMQLLVSNGNKLVGISGVEMKDKAQKHIGNFGISIAKDFRDKKNRFEAYGNCFGRI